MMNHLNRAGLPMLPHKRRPRGPKTPFQWGKPFVLSISKPSLHANARVRGPTAARLFAISFACLATAMWPGFLGSSRSNAIAASSSNSESQAGATGIYNGSGDIYSAQRDAKQGLLWQMWAKAFQFSRPSDVGTLNVSNITAWLYEKGKKKAVMTAPRATGYDVSKQLTAYGGVVVTSVAPEGTTLTADTVTYKATIKKIFATGHVVYTDKASGLVVRCPHLVTDAGLHDVTSDNVDMDIPASRLSKHK